MLLRLSLVLSFLTPIFHVLALVANSAATAADPISILSQGSWGALHTLSIVIFGVAQVMLAVAMAGMDAGRFWPYGRVLLAASGASLFYVAYFFAAADPAVLQGPGANDPLWVVACLVGFAMGTLQPGLARLAVWLGRFNLALLMVWLLLIPAILLIGVISLGAYERTVGAVYVIWVVGIGGTITRRHRSALI